MFTGDLSKLGQFARNLGKLSAVPSRIASEAAPKIDALIREEFASASDPYGHGWASLLPSTIDRKQGDDRVLLRSDAVLDTLRVVPMAGAGISVSIADYMGFHMAGTKWMTARPPLPIGTLPKTWNAAITGVANDAFRSVMAS